MAASLVNTKVTTVNLSFNEINSEAAADFAANLKGTKVTQIDLVKNLIDSPGTIATNLIGTNVIEVNLSCNQIGAQGAADFAANLIGTNVIHVDLSCNQIGSQGAADFAANLKNTNVTHLNLSHNYIDNAFNLLANLKDTKITELDLESNQIGRIFNSLGNCLKGAKVTRLSLRGNRFSTKDAANLMAKLEGTDVTHLDLSDNQINDQGVADLAVKLKNTKLTKIDLSLNKLGDRGAIALINELKNTLIKDLNLDCNELSEQILERLREALIVQMYAEHYGVLKLNQYFPLSETEKDQLINKTVRFANTKEPEQVALNIIRALPPELAAHVVSFLPGGGFNDRDETLQGLLSEFYNNASNETQERRTNKRNRGADDNESSAFPGYSTSSDEPPIKRCKCTK